MDSRPANDSHSKHPPPEPRDHERLIDAFDEAWHSARDGLCVAPEIADFLLGHSHSNRYEQLKQLIAIDLERRWSLVLRDPPNRSPDAGSVANDEIERRLLEDYARRFPELPPLSDLGLDLICTEYRVRQLWGDRPTHAEYATRFGASTTLREALLQVDRELEEQSAAEVRAGIEADIHDNEGQSELPNLPGYELRSIIGHGGSGVVYKAWHIGLKRTVAVKMILSGRFAPESEIRRLRSEATAVASLNHPNIVTIHEIGSHDGIHFFSLEYIPGRSLSRRIHDGYLPPNNAARILMMVAQAIEYAHQRGILHRDIKSSNVLIDPDEQPHITDFGLSTRIEGRSQITSAEPHLTGTHHVLGTPSYVSPEQAAGRRDILGPATDVYGLGATLYDALTGRPPFLSDTVAGTLQQVQFNQPVSPRKLRPNVPRDLEIICLKCLEKNPSARYTTAQELADDLQRYLNGEPIRARPVGLLGKTWRWCLRNPVVAGLSSVTALLLICLVATALLSSVSYSLSYRRESHQRNVAQEALQRERDANRQVYHSSLRQAYLEFRENNVAAARKLLQQTLPQHGAADWRGWEWYHLNAITQTNSLSLVAGQEDAERVYSLAFSPDAQWLATGTGVPAYLNRTQTTPGFLKIWSISTGDVVRELSGKVRSVVDLAFSSDGRLLAAAEQDLYWRRNSGPYEAPGSIRLWNTESGQETARFGDDEIYSRVAFSPGGTYLVAQRVERAREKTPRREDLQVWEVASGTERFRTAGMSICAFPSDDEIVGITEQSEMVLLRLKDGTRIRSLGLTPPGQRSSDGRFTAQISDDARTTSIWETASRQLLRTIYYEGTHAVAFRPGYPHIAIATKTGEIRMFDFLAGVEQFTLHGHSEHVAELAFDRAGAKLASGDWNGIVRVWNVTRNPEYLTLPSPGLDTRTEALTFDGSGRLASYNLRSGSLDLWDRTTAKCVTQHTVPFGANHFPPGRQAGISPDGRQLCVVNPEDPFIIDVWDIASGKRRLQYSQHGAPVMHIAFGNDSGTVASGAWHRSDPERSPDDAGELKVWSITDGSTLFELATESSRIYRLALDDDCKLLALSACIGDGRIGTNPAQVQMWNLHRRQKLWEQVYERSLILGLEFTPDARNLATADYFRGDIQLWDANQGHLVQRFAPRTMEIEDLTFSPDGMRLAGATRSLVALWEVETGQQVARLPTETSTSDYIFNPQVVFSHDGQHLAANQQDNTIRIWSGTPKSP